MAGPGVIVFFLDFLVIIDNASTDNNRKIRLDLL